MERRKRLSTGSSKNKSTTTCSKTVEPNRLPSYKRQPDLYHSHVWLDKEIYAQVIAFIGWEKEKKYSIKAAVRILLQMGLKKYAIDQVAAVAGVHDPAPREGHKVPSLVDPAKVNRKDVRNRGLPPRS
jgi:hypothetical protein